MAVAAVATAWSGWQATRWNSEQAKTASRPNAIRIDAARAQGLAEAQTEIDVATFTSGSTPARATRRARDSTWSASAPSSSPRSTPGSRRRLSGPRRAFDALHDAEFQLAANAEAERLDAEAEDSAAQVRLYIQRGSNYVLGVMLFAVSLFFAGIEHEGRRPSPADGHGRSRLHRLPVHVGLDRGLADQPGDLAARPARCRAAARTPRRATASTQERAASLRRTVVTSAWLSLHRAVSA